MECGLLDKTWAPDIKHCTRIHLKPREEGKFFLTAEYQLVTAKGKVRKSSAGAKIKGVPL